MPGLPLVAAFMEELMACKLLLLLQLLLRAAVEDESFSFHFSCF